MTLVALLQPGAMGARLGGQLVRAGYEVRWLAAGRSAATAERAHGEHLVPTYDVVDLVRGAGVVLSVVPPQLSVETAGLVAAAGFTGTYVDANPVSPATLRTVRSTVEETGAHLVDGGVVGPPPCNRHRTTPSTSREPLAPPPR